MSLEQPLNQHFSTTLSRLKDQLSAAAAKETDIDAVGVPLVRLRDKLNTKLHELAREESARQSVDWELVNSLQAKCQAAMDQLAALDAEAAELAAKEEQLRAALLQVQERKREAAKAIDLANSELSALSECSELALKELKSRLALVQALHGWTLAGLGPSAMVICYSRNGRDSVQVRLELAKDAKTGAVVVPAVKLHAPAGDHSVKNVLKHAPAIVKVEAGRGLLRTLLSVLNQLDRLHHIDRSLSRAGMHVDPRIAPDSPLITLTVFSLEKKRKYQVAVKVATDRLELCGVKVEYGAVEEESVRDAVDAGNLAGKAVQFSVFLERLLQ
jgi:hypothetical protein